MPRGKIVQGEVTNGAVSARMRAVAYNLWGKASFAKRAFASPRMASENQQADLCAGKEGS